MKGGNGASGANGITHSPSGERYGVRRLGAAFFFVAYGANADETPANRAEPCACRAKDFLDCVAVKE